MLVGANYGETGARYQIAGDQSGREVRKKDFYVYSRGWNCVLRPKDRYVADIIAQVAMDICENDAFGYDYTDRNTGYKAMKAVGWDASKVTEPCEVDCSSLVTTACAAAGIPENYLLLDGWNCLTTYVMRKHLIASGCFVLITDPEYLKSESKLEHGDIILNDLNHVEVVYKMSINEKKKYIEECYASLLYRTPTDKEIETWANTTKGHADLMHSIAYSAEGIREWIKTQYKLMLNREPDKGGLAAWTKAMQSGASRADIIKRIKASAEFKKLHNITK